MWVSLKINKAKMSVVMETFAANGQVENKGKHVETVVRR